MTAMIWILWKLNHHCQYPNVGVNTYASVVSVLFPIGGFWVLEKFIISFNNLFLTKHLSQAIADMTCEVKIKFKIEFYNSTESIVVILQRVSIVHPDTKTIKNWTDRVNLKMNTVIFFTQH